MYLVLAATIGVLFAAGVYLLLRRSVVSLIVGLALLGHGTNLFLFTAGGVRKAAPVFVPEGGLMPPAGHADPIPQALILTAIVISFAVIAFTAVLVKMTYRATADDDVGDGTSEAV